MKKLFILVTALALFTSCKKNDADKAGTFKGSVETIHDGKGWTWIKINAQGAPEQIGLSIDNAALTSMPVGEHDDGQHTHDNIVKLAFHPEAKKFTPFDHIQLDWNPTGHPPLQFYSEEHFDVHFYMVPQAEVTAAVDPTKLNAVPGPEYLPENYFSAGPVPQMGTHFLDGTSAEFHGSPFTQTFIYGSYDSKVTFYEPMITLDFLKATTNFERSIPQPAKFKTAGYYPTKMRIVKEGDVSNVILDGFIKREAS
jgi:hypothetical protein